METWELVNSLVRSAGVDEEDRRCVRMFSVFGELWDVNALWVCAVNDIDAFFGIETLKSHEDWLETVQKPTVWKLIKYISNNTQIKLNNSQLKKAPLNRPI